jgi:hypothetical protein
LIGSVPDVDPAIHGRPKSRYRSLWESNTNHSIVLTGDHIFLGENAAKTKAKVPKLAVPPEHLNHPLPPRPNFDALFPPLASQASEEILAHNDGNAQNFGTPFSRPWGNPIPFDSAAMWPDMDPDEWMRQHEIAMYGGRASDEYYNGRVDKPQLTNISDWLIQQHRLGLSVHHMHAINQFNDANLYTPDTSQLAPPPAGFQAAPLRGLSPTAAEFTTMAQSKTSTPSEQVRTAWGRPQKPGQPITPTPGEADWSYLVQRIVVSSDQQASILMQQKIKNATAEEKFHMCEAIIADAVNLSSNRFGNFLVQRCMEHGTPEQIIHVAKKLLNHVIALSMDSFGCHVMQKALDTVPESYKTLFIGELLKDIPKTVIHRYACHVWQKLFELRWEGEPPQIMQKVNTQLDGRWTAVAMGETGSLVVQNIFENCVEADKRPCIDEVLENIETIAKGQFGNWCIQHICENGAEGDRTRAITYILDNAAAYSIDQFGSKVIEKCLKIGGTQFINEDLARILEKPAETVRSPLIDIAGDQYGNYLIQWIITNASDSHYDAVVNQVRKHMVSLRGSKYGSRVAVMCNNNLVGARPSRDTAIRPGFSMGNNFFARGPGFPR